VRSRRREFVLSDAETQTATELIQEARALRREADELRSQSEQLRFQHRRVVQESARRREAARAWSRTPCFVPSPWSSLPWQSPAQENFEEVLIRVQ
jgi:hypothetical protein